MYSQISDFPFAPIGGPNDETFLTDKCMVNYVRNTAPRMSEERNGLVIQEASFWQGAEPLNIPNPTDYSVLFV